MKRKNRWKRILAMVLAVIMLPIDSWADCTVSRVQAVAVETLEQGNVQSDIQANESDVPDGLMADANEGADIQEDGGKAEDNDSEKEGKGVTSNHMSEQGGGITTLDNLSGQEGESQTPNNTSEEGGESTTPDNMSEEGGESTAPDNMSREGGESTTPDNMSKEEEKNASQDTISEQSEGNSTADSASERLEKDNNGNLSEVTLDGYLDDHGVVQLSWKAETGTVAEGRVTEFYVYKNGSLFKTVSADEGGVCSYADEDLEASEDYVYRVEGKDEETGTIASSNEVMIHTPQALVIDNHQTIYLSEDMDVFNLELKNGYIYLNGHTLKIYRDYKQSSGSVYFYGGSILCNGSFVKENNSYLIMSYDQDYLYVGGDVSFKGENRYESFSRGTIETKGNFEIDYNGGRFSAYSTQKIILSGEQKQLFSVPKGSQINILELRNDSEEGVWFSKPIVVNQMIDNGHVIQYENVDNQYGRVLTEDEVYEGDFVLISGDLDLNGHSLTVKGSFYQLDGIVDVNGGKLVVEGDYRLQGDFSENIDDVDIRSQGMLKMVNADDYVLIGGMFFSKTEANAKNLLTAGVMEVKGDFVYRDYYSLMAEDAHELILSGENSQTLSGVAVLGNLILQNQSKQGVILETTPVVTGHVSDNNGRVSGRIQMTDSTTFENQQFNGGIYVGSEIYFDREFFVGKDLSIAGKAHISGTLKVGGNCNILNYGILKMEGGEVLIDGDLYADSEIDMNSADDRILVKGDFVNRSSAHRLTAGTFELKGNMISTRSLNARENHRFLFSGDQKQTIDLEADGSFAIIELQNYSEDGVWSKTVFKKQKLIKNGCRLMFEGQLDEDVVTLQEDTVHEGEYVLEGSILDLNGYRLTIKGDLIHESGMINIDGGELIVEGDYYLQDRSETADGYIYSEGTGRLLMNSDEDYILVKGNLTVETSARELQDLTAGKLELYGDYRVIKCNSQYGFSFEKDHTLVISGSRKQNLYVEQGSINHIELKNTSEEGIVFENTIWVCGVINDVSGHVQGTMGFSSGASGYFSGDAVMYEYTAIYGQLEIGGNLCLLSEHRYYEDTGRLHVFGEVIVHGDCKGEGFDIAETGHLKVLGDLQVDTYINVCGGVDVQGDCNWSGRYHYVKSGAVTVGGNMVISGPFSMTNEKDYIHVKGDLVYKYGYSAGELSNGTVEIEGDFISEGIIRATGNHRFLFSGDRKQVIQATSKDSFAIVELQNSSAEGVVVDGNLVRSILIKNGSKFSYVDQEEGEWVLEADEVYSGDFVSNHRYLDLNGHQLTVEGNYILDSGMLFMNGGQLIVHGDFIMQKINEGGIEQQKNSSSNAFFRMCNQDDHILVQGNFIVDSERSSEGNLTAGTIEVRGDMKVFQTGNAKAFYPTEDHVVSLSGDRKQSICFENSSASTSHVHNLIIDNDCEEGVEIEEELYVSGHVRDNQKVVKGTLTIGYNTTFENNSFNGSIKIVSSQYIRDEFTVKGDLYVASWMSVSKKMLVGSDCILLDGGCISMNCGELTILGDLEIAEDKSAYVYMTHEDDYICVMGNAVFSPKTSSSVIYLATGTLEVKGDFISKRGVRTKGNHRVLLSGTEKQTIEIDSYSAQFAILELDNQSEEGVEIIADKENYITWDELITHNTKLTYRGEVIEPGTTLVKNWLLASDKRVEGNLLLLGGSLYLNGHSLEVTGEVFQRSGNMDTNGGILHVGSDYVQAGGSMNLNGGKLIVDGDYRLQSRTGERDDFQYGMSSGYLRMRDEKDYVQVKGSFLSSTDVQGDTYYNNYLSAGTLEVQGDFIVDTTYSNRSFYATGELTLLLSGDKKQVFYLGSDGTSGNRIYNLEVSNQSEEGVTIEGVPYILKKVNDPGRRISGTVRVSSCNVFSSGYFGGNVISCSSNCTKNVEIKGDLTFEGSYSYYVSSKIQVGGDLYVQNSLTVRTGARLSVSGGAYVSGTLYGEGQLEIAGDCVFMTGGAISISTGSLNIDGDFVMSQEANGSFSMSNSVGYVSVGGNVTCNNSRGQLKAGTWEIKGDFVTNDRLSVSDGYKFVFSGDKPQTVELLSGGSFSDVEFRNFSEEGITLKNVTVTGRLYQYGSKLSGDEIAGYYTRMLCEDETYEGDYVLTKSLALNGHTLTVEGNLIHYGGYLTIGQGNLIVGKDYLVQNPSEEVKANGIYTYRYLSMAFDESYMLVKGNILIDESITSFTAGFSRGILEVMGDITINYNKQCISTSTYYNHTILMSGGRKQTISSKGLNTINYLESLNSTDEGVVIESNIKVIGKIIPHGNPVSGRIYLSPTTGFEDGLFTGSAIINENMTLTKDLVLGGDIIIQNQADVKGRIEVAGNCTITGTVGKLNLNQGRLIVGGNLNGASYVYMTHEGDYLHVKGDANFSKVSAVTGHFTAGIFEVEGDLNSDRYIYATGTHEFLFSGNQKQVITLGEGEFFANVRLQNDSEEGVIFNSFNITESFEPGESRYEIVSERGMLGWTLEKDQVYEGDLKLCGLTLDLNGHVLTVTGDLLQTSGKLLVNGGQLIVYGDYKLDGEQSTSTAVDGRNYGRLIMQNPEDRVLIYGDFLLNTGASLTGCLTAGNIELKGNFRRTKNTTQNFSLAWADHTFIFSGEKDQNLNISGGTIGGILNRCAGTLHIENSCVATGNLTDEGKRVTGTLTVRTLSRITDGYWSGELNILSNVSITQQRDLFVGGLYIGSSSGGYINKYSLGGHRLETGFLTIYSGELQVQDGSVVCAKDLNIYNSGKLVMQNPDGNVFVGGNFNMTSYANHTGLLTDGTLEIQGNFYQGSYNNFIATENHKVILSRRRSTEDGMQLQQVRFSYNPGTTRFNTLILKKNLECYSFNVDLEQIANEVIYDIEDEKAPNAVTTLEIVEENVTSIVLRYDGARDESGVLGYEIYRDGEKIGVTSETSYTDTGLSPSTKYTYQVYPFDVYWNCCTDSPKAVGVTADDVEAPTKPADLHRLTRTGSSITLSWRASTDNVAVTGYAVYRNGEQIAEGITETTYKDQDLEKNKAYRYVVAAYDGAGNVSETSDVLEATVAMPEIVNILPKEYSSIGGDGTTVTVVFRNSGNSTGNRVKIEKWNAKAEGEDIQDGGEWILLTPTLLNQKYYNSANLCATYDLDLSHVTDARDCKLRVTLYDADGNTDVREVTYYLDKQAPKVPENFRAAADNGTVRLTWDASVSADCTSYQLYRKAEDADDFKLWKTLSGRYSTSYVDAEVVPGMQYSYALTAADTFANVSELSEAVTVLVDEDLEAPLVKDMTPKAGRIAGETEIQIQATDNREVVKVQLRYRAEKEDQWIHLAEVEVLKGLASYAWNTTLLKDEIYIVSAVAVDSSGNESHEAFTRRYEVDNTGIAKIEITDVNATATAVQLRWADVTESDFGCFKVEQFDGSDFVEVATVTDTLGYAKTDLKPETAYEFRVVGYDNLGNKGEYSDVVKCTTTADTTLPTIGAVYPIASYYKDKLALRLDAKDNAGLGKAVFSYSRDGESFEEIAVLEAPSQPKDHSFTYSFDISSLEEGDLYIKFEAYDAAGNKNALLESGEEIIVKYIIDRTAPAKVENLKVSGAQGYIGLRWDEMEEKDIKAFRIYRADASTGIFTLLQSECSTKNYYDTTVQTNQSYIYKVSAIDIAGNEGACSEEVYATVARDAEAPEITGMSPADHSTVGKIATIKALAMDNAQIRQVVLEYRKAGEEQGAWTKIQEFTANERGFLAAAEWNTAELEEGDYVVRASATDFAGNQSEVYEVTYTLDHTPPEAAKLSTRTGNFKITLDFSSEKSEDFAYYEIQRRTVGSDAFRLLDKGVENTYIDTDVIPDQVYIYRVGAYDLYGNVSWSEEVEGYATEEDDVAPNAVLPDRLVGLVGMEMAFDGMGSTDNVRIVEYLWNMGDGTSKSGPQPIHAYAKAGTYTVTLQVKDAAGNADTAQTTVTVQDRAGRGISRVQVVDEKGKPIPYALVYANLGNGEILSLQADGNGQATIAAAAGAYNVAAYHSGYIPDDIDVIVSEYEIREYTLTLVEDELIVGELTVRRMTMEEMREAGVDFSAPENYNAFIFVLTLVYKEEPIPVNVIYEYIGGEPGEVLDGEHFKMIGGSSKPDSQASSIQIQGIGTGTDLGGQPNEPILVYVRTIHSISWLKEMYEVELGILNTANARYVIENSAATLNLPAGVSLAKTTGGQSLTQSMGSIKGQERKSVFWVVKGDRSGKYKLTADFEGILMPFEAKVNATFETESEFEVQTGEGIHITVMPESTAYDGELLYIHFKITNASDRPLYNFRASMPGYYQPDRKYIFKNVDTGETEVLTEPNLSVSNPNRLGQSMIGRDGSTIHFVALMPGDSYYGTQTLLFPGTGNEDVYYQLIESYVDVLRGANLGVTVSIEPIAGHISAYYYRGEVVDYSGLYGDPIDISTGFFTDELTAFSLQGASALELGMQYSSGATDAAGELGYGWYHGYETWLEQRNGIVYYHATPFLQAGFLHEDMKNNVLYGTMQDGKISLAEGEEYTYGRYLPLSSSLKDVSLVRNTDGTYTLVTQSGSIQTFDADGKLIRVEDGDGLSVSIRRSDEAMTLRDDVSGKEICLHYDQNRRLTSVTDDYGRKTTFTYEGDCLTTVTSPAGVTVSYTYDEQNRILTEANPEGVFVVNEYDEKGRVTRQVDALGTVSTLTYEEREDGGMTVRAVDAAGNAKTVEVDENGRITKITDADGSTVEYTYNARGQVTSEKDAYGKCVFKEYDAQGNLLVLTDTAGRKTTMTYDGQGRLLTITNDDGQTASYQYDGQGRIRSYQDFSGTEKKYEYNEQGQLVKEETEGLGAILYGYENGMLTSMTDYLGNVTASVYDGMGNLIQTTDALGNVTAYTYDAVGRTTSVTDALGNITRYAYDHNGNVISVTDALGNVTAYEYDRAGRRTKVTYPDGTAEESVYDALGDLVALIHPDGSKNTYAYDTVGNLIRETLPDGTELTYGYDLLRQRISEKDESGREVRYEYYPNGKPYKVLYPDGTYELYTYNSQWEVAAYTNTAGHTTSYEYDAMSRVTLERDALGNVWRYAYDRAGRMTQATDPNGNVTSYAYDANGNCVKVTDALGHETHAEYDALNRVTSVYQMDRAGGEVRVTYTYDALGRVCAVTDEMGNVSRMAYDALGNPVSVTGALGNVTAVSEYDPMGRVIKSTDALGLVTEYSYDETGKLLKVIERLNGQKDRITFYEYDIMERPTQVTDPLAGITRISYDESGRISSFTDANGGVTRYAYDSVGRLLEELNPIGAKYEYTYNAQGLLKELTNARGQKTVYEYDAIGRVTSVTDELGTVNYTYDKNGNVLTVSDENGTIQRTYDALNRVTKYVDYRGNEVGYGYDELGNLIALTYPGGEIVRYTYYKNGLLYTAEDPEGRITRYEYDANGNLTRTVRPNGTEELCAYNEAGQLVEQRDVRTAADGEAPEELTSYTYTYDGYGNITSIEGTQTLESAEGLSRLTSAKMTYDEANRLLTYNGEEVRYDADGNMTYGPVDGVMGELVYDCRNRLVSAGGVTYAYDPENVRISAETEAYKEFYVTDTVSGTLSRVLTAARHEKQGGEVSKEGIITLYLHGNGLISEEREGSLLYHHYNHLGSTMALTDGNGEVIAEYAYGAYGELLSGDSALTRFLYNGRCGVSTDDNGLYYMRQRYYNTEIKRFVNQDILTGSAGNSQSLNRYSYVQGNPVKYTDPFGLSPINGLFSGSNIRHALLGFASCIPVIGVIASAADAWYYYKEGNTAMAMACTVDAVIGLLSGGGSLLTKFSKTEQIGRAIQVAAKIGNGGVGLYRNTTTFGKSAVDFYVRHEGTFFTKNFQWELADAGDFLSMALSGAGAAQSVAGLASGINEAAKAYRQWKEIDALKNSCCQNGVTTKCGGDGTHCFIAGTLVKTADGDKPIEEISVGDEVLSYDVYTGECSYKKVLQVFVNEATELAHVEAGGEIITATTNHPFYVVGYGFLEAGRLQAGDRIRLANGEIREIESITIEHLEEPVKVYNFEVEDWHTYFVGEKGVLVHNMCVVNGITGETSCGNSSLKFGDNDLVYGPTANGELKKLKESAGGKMLSDVGGPFDLGYRDWLELSLDTIENTVRQGNYIHFDLTYMQDIDGILKGTSQYMNRVTSGELIYIRDNWDRFSGNIKFYNNGKEVLPPWMN